MRKSLFTKFLIGAAAVAMFALPAMAQEAPQVFTTPDNVLSIEAPSSAWSVVNGSNWFEISDGNCDIAISHLSNGEALPAQSVANDSKGAVVQTLISTKNEVFAVNATSANQQDLQTLIKAVGTIQVLTYDTKTAVKTETTEKKAENTEAKTEAPAQASSEAGKTITVYTEDGSEAVLTLGEDGIWKDREGVFFHNTVDNMYVDDLNGLYWNTDPNYWKNQGEQNWVTIYSENGNTDEIALGTDNVWRNHNGDVFTFDTVDTYVGPGGEGWAIYPDYWNNAPAEEGTGEADVAETAEDAETANDGEAAEEDADYSEEEADYAEEDYSEDYEEEAAEE